MTARRSFSSKQKRAVTRNLDGRSKQCIDRSKCAFPKAVSPGLRVLDNPDVTFRFDVVEVLLPEEAESQRELIQNAF